MTLAAYQRSTLPRLGYTYERAMSLPHLATCLRHLEQTEHRQHQASDTMYCSCGKSWDVSDNDIPESCK